METERKNDIRKRNPKIKPNCALHLLNTFVPFHFSRNTIVVHTFQEAQLLFSFEKAQLWEAHMCFTSKHDCEKHKWASTPKHICEAHLCFFMKQNYAFNFLEAQTCFPKKHRCASWRSTSVLFARVLHGRKKVQKLQKRRKPRKNKHNLRIQTNCAILF